MFNDLDIYRPRGIPAGGLIDDIVAAHYAAGTITTPAGPPTTTKTRGFTIRELLHEIPTPSIATCIDIILISMCLSMILTGYDEIENKNILAGIAFIAGAVLMLYLAIKKGKTVKKRLRPITWNSLKKRIMHDYKKKYSYTATHDNNGKTIKLYPSITNSRVFVPEHELKQEIDKTIHHMLASGKLPRNINTDVAGYKAFFGAVAELHTAHLLHDISGCSLYNDIAIILKNGHVTANIDHLVYHHNSKHTIMVDSKFLSQLPQFVSDNNGNLMVNPTDQHKRMVSTCLYEASFLPQKPYAVIFAVAGNATENLRKNPVQVTTYTEFDRYNNPIKQKPCPVPVFFVAQDEIKKFINNLLHNDDWADMLPDHKKSQADPKKYIGKKIKRGKNHVHMLQIQHKLQCEN